MANFGQLLDIFEGVCGTVHQIVHIKCHVIHQNDWLLKPIQYPKKIYKKNIKSVTMATMATIKNAKFRNFGHYLVFFTSPHINDYI